MQRHETTDGGFVDLPKGTASGVVALRAVADDAAEDAGVYLRGVVLATDGEWTVVSCGGLLARLPYQQLPPQQSVRLHAV